MDEWTQTQMKNKNEQIKYLQANGARQFRRTEGACERGRREEKAAQVWYNNILRSATEAAWPMNEASITKRKIVGEDESPWPHDSATGGSFFLLRRWVEPSSCDSMGREGEIHYQLVVVAAPSWSSKVERHLLIATALQWIHDSGYYSMTMTIAIRLGWLAGFCDVDGCFLLKGTIDLGHTHLLRRTHD